MPGGRWANDKGNEKKIQGTNDQVKARAEHVINFPDIVCGPRHQIANRLEIMEGHVLAEQVDIQFLPDHPLDLLGDDLKTIIPGELQKSTQDLGPADNQGIIAEDEQRWAFL